MASVLQVILRVTGQSSLGGTFTGLNQGLELAQAGVQALNDTVGEFVRQGVHMNSFLESSELQFKTLTGSADTAHEHVQMLFDLAAHTPFTFESVTTASRQLEVFGGAALDTQDNLRMLGDSAAATGAPIEQVTFWTGRLYSALQAGAPIGEASRWLQQMGVVSGATRQRLDELSASGANGAQIWQAFTESQQRFTGAMKAQEQTWVGLTSTMSDLFAQFEGQATRGTFKQLEQEVSEFNRVLASPAAAESAKVIDAALSGLADPIVRLTEILTGDTEAILKNSGAWDDWHRSALAAQEQAEKNAAKWVDLRTAGQDFLRQQQEQAAMTITLGDASEIALKKEQAALVSLGMELAANETNLDHWDAIARQSGATASENAEIWQNWQQHVREANDALYQQGQLLATLNQQGDQFSRHPPTPPTTDADIQQAQQQREAFLKQIADAEERNRRQAAENEKDAFNAAADAIREKNQETADAIREAQQASQEAVRRAYVGTADEAEAQFQRITHAITGVGDSMVDMQRELDEATNRQVRAGTAGSDAAAKELEDIRRRYLTMIPDLTALDREWTDARIEQRQADIALAAAQRNLAVALAASGGQQTLQTAALSHNVTAAQAAAQAALDHANALAMERGQAISLTNALAGLSAAQGGGGGLLLQDTGSQANRTRIYGMPITQPTIVTNHITNHGPVGVDDLGRQITDTVNNGLRNGSVRVPGLATR